MDLGWESLQLVNITEYRMLSIMCGLECCDGGWGDGGYNGLAVKTLLSLYLENSCHVNNLWEIAPNKNYQVEISVVCHQYLQSLALHSSR